MQEQLNRFLRAQEATYNGALQELEKGEKEGCWMWFVFPQLRGLGQSPISCLYGIADLQEAKAYLAHPILGGRLVRCCQVLLAHGEKTAEDIFGEVDAMKLRSSMTLFHLAGGDTPVFWKVLEQFFHGQMDQRTLAMVSK